ncbi:unnamed protein product [Clonostachys byssicola]|uniref:Centromere protein X n=1 Tax=Clonostachys byssicola TaxID=160290 RepID=A0A9N9XXS1_9HYPO|nr:unnamed protein product [Clonostachys byssicola]
MPPKKASKDSASKASRPSKKPQSSDPFASDDEVEDTAARPNDDRGEEDEPAAEKTIPKELLTRLLHEFFTKDATRISRDANAAVGKYVDVFVEDLEKATPQLLLDL